MKKRAFLLGLIYAFLFSSCASSMVPGEEIVVEKSASRKPSWILVPPRNTE